MMERKHGQSAQNAGTLVIIITVVLLLYILFIPPETRDDLLFPEGVPGDDNESFAGAEVLDVVLNERVGELNYVNRLSDQYSIQPFTVTTNVRGATLATKDSLRAETSVFESTEGVLRFSSDTDLTGDVILSFNVMRGEGELTVSLNGEQIYVDEISAGNAEPIKIRSSELQDTNEVTFTVDSPGLLFWTTNDYVLDNVRVVGRVLDETQSVNQQSFYITPSDFNNIERARISYLAECTEENIEEFQVAVNNFELFSGVPDCALNNFKDFNPQALRPGNNDIRTTIGRGTVLVDRVIVTTYYEDTDVRTLYFDIPAEYFDNDGVNGSERLEDDLEATATFTFTNEDRKEFNVFVNGYLFGVNTRERTYSMNITKAVQPEFNSLELEPKNDIRINDVTVRIIEEDDE